CFIALGNVGVNQGVIIELIIETNTPGNIVLFQGIDIFLTGNAVKVQTVTVGIACNRSKWLSCGIEQTAQVVEQGRNVAAFAVGINTHLTGCWIENDGAGQVQRCIVTAVDVNGGLCVTGANLGSQGI